MCGIFGLIRCSDDASADTRRQATIAFVSLGVHSEERGTDSSGIAMAIASPTARTTFTDPDTSMASARATVVDGCYIAKDAKPFHDLPLSDWAIPMDMATVLLGHTRAATQGAVEDLCNASPLLAGALVGTHNGDVDVVSVPGRRALARHALGATDSERIYLALNAARTDRRAMTQVLKMLQGRAALAFIDRTRPDRLYLARTALSPLCFAYDQHGNFYYASNPDWFRRIESAEGSETVFSDLTLIPEGHLVTVSTLTGQVEDVRRFTPTCRERDLRLINSAVYRGFRAEDKLADMDLHRHKVVSPPLPKWPTLTLAPVIATVAEAAEQVQASGVADPVVAEDAALECYDEVAAALDELEDLCWASGTFDHWTYERILDADPEDFVRLMDELREQVADMVADAHAEQEPRQQGQRGNADAEVIVLRASGAVA